MRTAGLALLCLVLPAAAPRPEPGLDPPVRMEADGKPIDVFGGHAAPALADLDGDGVRDLLVGQFLGEGTSTLCQATMRSYRNAGTDKAPRFEGFQYMSGGDTRAWVPTG